MSLVICRLFIYNFMGLIIVLFVSIIKIILEVFRYRLIVLKAIFPKRIDWIKGNMYIRIQVGIKRITDRTGKKTDTNVCSSEHSSYQTRSQRTAKQEPWPRNLIRIRFASNILTSTLLRLDPSLTGMYIMAIYFPRLEENRHDLIRKENWNLKLKLKFSVVFFITLKVLWMSCLLKLVFCVPAITNTQLSRYSSQHTSFSLLIKIQHMTR